MASIDIPLTAAQRGAGPVLVSLLGGLVLCSGLAWPGRGLIALGVLVGGLACWQRHLARRAAVLSLDPERRLHCVRADGVAFVAARIRAGVVAPGLLSARLASSAGETCDLLLPGWGTPPRLHRQARRLLLAARELPSAEPRAADQRERRGT
jgi:hypothetical protein